MSPDQVLSVVSLGAQWQTLDPFLFCVHHDDAYPRGNAHLGLDADELHGRDIGMDFSGRDGWSMYHGAATPGFPRHPHRGFETVTLARHGYIDHSDSLGAAARFGEGDVQWMTAGRGIVHSEMFPLVNADSGNPTELFQIWLNLPGERKLAEPYFSMLWSETLPRVTPSPGVDVLLVAGAAHGVTPPQPPPDSWAAHPDAHVAIWSATLAPGATWTVPCAPDGLNRVLYCFAGTSFEFNGRAVTAGHAAQVDCAGDLQITNGATPGEVLLLQGRPIGEPVAQHGPFVMNTAAEIRQAFADYRVDEFGGWPWGSDGPVHARDAGRFARQIDGTILTPASRTRSA